MNGLDEESAALLAGMEASGAPHLYELPVDQARNLLAEASKMGGAGLPDGAVAEDVMIPGKDGDVPIRIYRPAAQLPAALIVFFHGGGWALGSIETHDAIIRAFTGMTNAVIVSVNYRLAPEHPFPAGLRDCYDAFDWAAKYRRELNAQGLPLIVMGDSAGGNLAASVALQARDAEREDIDAQILLYPCVDLDVKGPYPSMDKYGDGSYFLGRADVDWLVSMYMPPGQDIANPLASPIKAPDLSGLPPASIITAGFDPLKDQGRVYYESLRAAGNTASYYCAETTVHGFISFAGQISAGRDALKKIAAHVNSLGGSALDLDYFG